eukprot:6398341-Lingulodinium_polyedra.AAC.1
MRLQAPKQVGGQCLPGGCWGAKASLVRGLGGQSPPLRAGTKASTKARAIGGSQQASSAVPS